MANSRSTRQLIWILGETVLLRVMFNVLLSQGIAWAIGGRSTLGIVADVGADGGPGLFGLMLVYLALVAIWLTTNHPVLDELLRERLRYLGVRYAERQIMTIVAFTISRPRCCQKT
jgi:hypothetical protein